LPQEGAGRGSNRSNEIKNILAANLAQCADVAGEGKTNRTGTTTYHYHDDDGRAQTRAKVITNIHKHGERINRL